MSAMPARTMRGASGELVILRDLVSGGEISARVYALPRVVRQGGEGTAVLRVVSKKSDELPES